VTLHPVSWHVYYYNVFVVFTYFGDMQMIAVLLLLQDRTHYNNAHSKGINDARLGIKLSPAFIGRRTIKRWPGKKKASLDA